MRADAFAGGNPAIERHQGIDHARRTGDLRGPGRAIELGGAVSAAASGEIVGNMRLIVAQHVDAEHPVLEQRGDHGAQVMNAHQKGGLRSIGRYRHHGGHSDAMAPGDAIGGDHIHGAGGMAHAMQELLPQGAISRRRRWLIPRTTHDSYSCTNHA